MKRNQGAWKRISRARGSRCGDELLAGLEDELELLVLVGVSLLKGLDFICE